MKNSSVKIIVIVVAVVLVLLVGGYFLILAPKKYSEGNLSFKLPHGFHYSSSRYVKELYDDPIGGTVYCDVSVKKNSYTSKAYETRIDFLKKAYSGQKDSKQINGSNWDHISGVNLSATDSDKVDVYLVIDNSDYYEVEIKNSNQNPCSTKDIDTIVNSLTLN